MHGKVPYLTIRNHRLTVSLLFAKIAVLLIACSIFFGSHSAYADFSDTYSHVPKPMEFYFHCIDVPVHVAGLDTKYVMNTTQSFEFQSQNESYENSFYKPIGQPKVAVDFYLYPNLAGPVTVNGSWQVFLWVNASAYKPVGFDLQYRELDVGGTTLWDSGPLSPIVTSSIDGYIDVPVLNYNLTVTLEHTFDTGATIQVEVTVNAGSSADTRIWYDSPYYPSKAILPLEDYARSISLKTFDHNYTETNAYSVFWNETQRIVIVRANVTDPLGGYDIYMTNITIQNPAQQKVLDNTNMTRKTDGTWETQYSHIYGANWSYPDTAMPGNYTIEVTVIDNNGLYSLLLYDTFEPFIERAYQTFTIGIQHPVLIRALDAHNQSLANAKIQAVSDQVVLAEGSTNSLGYWQTSLWVGNYNITVNWQNTEVAKQPIQVINASQFTILCNVHYPTIKIVDDTNQTLPDAEVYFTSPNGTITVPPIYTDATGIINLTQAPAGNYAFTIMWKGIKVQDTSVTINSDGPYTIRTKVYQVTVNVLGNDKTSINGAYVIIYTQSGIGYGLELTNQNGQATFRLPEATYRIDVRYSTVYWLTAVTSNATQPNVPINSSRTIDIALQDYPPPIWMTIQFWLITTIILATVIILIAILLQYLKQRR